MLYCIEQHEEGPPIMMKKSLSILLLLTLCLSASFALAQTAETQIPELVFDETTAAYQGAWIPFKNGFQLYLPTDWNVLEVSEEDANQGVMAVFASPDSTAKLAVTYGDITEADNAAMVASLQAAGMKEVSEVIINGITVVCYTAADDSSTGVAMPTGQGGAFVFTFAPASEAFMPIVQTMFSSLSIVEE